MGDGVASKRQQSEMGDRQVAKNRRAHFDYTIESTLEAGLVLTGSEVRSLRQHGANLGDAWVDIDSRNEAWVKQMRIPPLVHAAFGHHDTRPRKLLMHDWQIAQLAGKVQREGMTLIATRCYFRNNRAKLEVALAKGKKQHDKRRTIRERELDREARAAMRRGRE